MEQIQKVDELYANDQISFKREKKPIKPCIYYSHLECTVPNCHFEVCKNCPRGAIYCIPQPEAIYEKIVELARFFS
jgi:hypothetical protein